MLRRSLFAIFCVIILLFTFVISAFAAEDPIVKSPGVGQHVGNNLIPFSAPAAINVSSFIEPYSSNVDYNFGLSIDPVFFYTGSDSEGDYEYSNYTSDVVFGPSESPFFYSFTESLERVYMVDMVYNSDTYMVSGELTYDYYFCVQDINSMEEGGTVYFSSSDFYVWNDDIYESSFESEINFLLPLGFTFNSITFTYSLPGSSVQETLVIESGENINLDQGVIFLSSNLFPNLIEELPYVYIHSMVIDTSCPYFYFRDHLLSIAYCYNPQAHAAFVNYQKPFDSDNPALPLLDYTAWLGTAVTGFLDLQIFPRFTLGGLLMTLIAFCCVLWFLKLVAGG